MLQKSKYFKLLFAIFFIFAIGLLPILNPMAGADTASDLQAAITAKNSQIQALQAEIAQYEQSIDQTSAQAKTLQSELTSLTTAKKKLQAELQVTETNLSKTTAVISDLSLQINTTENSIIARKSEIALALRNIRDSDDTSTIEALLSAQNFSDVADYVEGEQKLVNSLKASILDLNNSEQTLSSQKSDQQSKQSDLKKLKSSITGQTQALSETADQKAQLLTDTKGQEANYQKILTDKKALELQFENDLFQYESNLGIKVNPAGYPSPEHGILSWPLDTAIVITQMFGKTSSSGRLYASGTHNGTDFHATDGTPVHAALGGTVRAIGNTDLKKNCLSYGKWVLVDHPNGLSTLYAHFSAFNVKPGDAVSTGDIIGWSGRTGYVTGPHLHLTVLVSASTQVMLYPPDKAINCGGVTIPIAPPAAFLDPMAYLPLLSAN